MTKEDIQKHIDAMPAYISISDIEKRVGMPATTLQKTLNGERDLPTKWIKPLQDFFGLKKTPEVIPAVQSVTKPKVAEKTAPKEPVTTEKAKTYADYMKMSGAKIKEHWDEIKKSKLTPGQRSTLYAKIK